LQLSTNKVLGGFNKKQKIVEQKNCFKKFSVHNVTSFERRGAARIFLRGGAEIMEAKAMKRKNCLS